MKNFEKIGAQGEIVARKIDALPNGLEPFTKENGKWIIGHSESGHHHVLDRPDVQVMRDPNPPAGMQILYAVLDNPTALIQERNNDAHEGLDLGDSGVIEFRISREWDPYEELARRVAD